MSEPKTMTELLAPREWLEHYLLPTDRPDLADIKAYAEYYHAHELAAIRKAVEADSYKDDWMIDVVNLKDVLAILDAHKPKP